MLSYPNEINPVKSSPQLISSNKAKPEETKPNSFISTDSTNDTNIIQSQKKQKYIFENNNKSYSIVLILFEDKIKIIVNPLTYGTEEYYYERDFSQEELKTNNKVFKLCNDIEESFEYFNDLFQDSQNQLLVNESNDFFNIEKKLQLSLPLKIEITKKYKNNKININKISNNINNNINNEINIKNNDKINFNLNNDIKNVSPICNTNNEIQDRIDFLDHENAQLLKLVKNNYIHNEERIKKRINVSDLSDISFNSNDNEVINKKNKNLEKENFLKIFSDNNSINSGDSNEKFFMKILKKKKLEEENNRLEQNKNNINSNNNNNNNNEKNNIINFKKDIEENENYLYGEQDSSDEIKDDIDFFSNNSPSITPAGPKNGNNNDNLSFLLSNDKNKSFNDNKLKSDPSFFHKNSYQNEVKLKSNNIYDKISHDKGSDRRVNNSYNMIGSSQFRNYSNSKKNKDGKIYKIIHENSVESCNMEKSYEFNDKNVYSNNIFSIDSKIISNCVEFDFIINYLKNELNKEITNSIRIYRATEDGDKADDFHRLCDGNTNLIILIKTKDGKKFGGYTSIGFNNYNQSNLDDTAFIFSIDKREIYPNIRGKNAIESYYNLGPTFSGDSIKIYDNFFKKGGITSKIGTNYQTNEDYQINDGKKIFAVEEIEVLELLEMKIDNNI